MQDKSWTNDRSLTGKQDLLLFLRQERAIPHETVSGSLLPWSSHQLLAVHSDQLRHNTLDSWHQLRTEYASHSFSFNSPFCFCKVEKRSLIFIMQVACRCWWLPQREGSDESFAGVSRELKHHPFSYLEAGGLFLFHFRAL